MSRLVLSVATTEASQHTHRLDSCKISEPYDRTSSFALGVHSQRSYKEATFVQIDGIYTIHNWVDKHLLAFVHYMYSISLMYLEPI